MTEGVYVNLWIMGTCVRLFLRFMDTFCSLSFFFSRTHLELTVSKWFVHYNMAGHYLILAPSVHLYYSNFILKCIIKHYMFVSIISYLSLSPSYITPPPTPRRKKNNNPSALLGVCMSFIFPTNLCFMC